MDDHLVQNRMPSQKYVDILTNGGFKALFGDENNKDVVMNILNTLLPENRRVVSIEYMPTERQGQVVNQNKEYHYDFMCRDDSGTVFIVELQKYYEDNWFKRCVSYASRAYDRQNRRGENYDVPPVYLIGLMGVNIAHKDMSKWKDRYLSEYTFREKLTNELLDETIVIIFAELARFKKKISECITSQDIMMYVLKNIWSMHEKPEWLQGDMYDRLFNACEIAGFTEDKLLTYESDMNDEKRLMGEYSAYRRIGMELGLKEGRAEGLAKGREEGLAKGRAEGLAEGREEGLAEGREEGREEGLAEGREEGLAEGRAEGREEGIFEGKAEIIRQMYFNNIKKEHIEEITGVPIAEIDKMLAR